MPKPIVAWVMFLFSINLIPALIFLKTLEGQLVLGGLMPGTFLQTWIFSKKGFVKLLRLGHILWLPMVIWLAYRFGKTIRIQIRVLQHETQLDRFAGQR